MAGNGEQGKRLELRAELPSRLGYQRRAVARHLVLGKEVEFRILREEASPEQVQAFQRELVLLTALELPGLVPVLDRGRHGERLYYCIPLRKDPWLDDLATSPDCALEERWMVVQDMARVLAGFHVREQTLGPLLPETIRWDRLGGRAILHFLPHLPEAVPGSALPPLPAHLTRAVPDPLGMDVLHWAWFSWWFLASGEPACTPQQEHARPLGQLAPEVPEHLREVIDICLGARPGEAPRSGIELSLVQRTQLGEMLRFVSRNLTVAESGSLAASIASVRGELERSGKQVYLEASGATGKPLPSSGVSLSLVLEEAGVSAGRTPAGRWGLAALVLLGVLLGAWWFPGGALSGGNSRSPGSPGSPVAPSAPGTRFRHARERFVKELLQLEAVTPANFRQSFVKYKNLALRRRLPPGMGSIEELKGLEKSFQEDEIQGCERFQVLLGRLRAAVGDAPGGD